MFWPGESHGLYTPRDRKEADGTERLSLSLRDFKYITRFEQPPARGERERCLPEMQLLFGSCHAPGKAADGS